MIYAILFISCLNFLFLIAIAASLSKLIRYSQEDVNSKDEWAKIIKNRQSVDTQRRLPNYSEEVKSVLLEDKSQNWDGIPKGSKNWDGIPR
jgi:hypothetical protein